MPGISVVTRSPGRSVANLQKIFNTLGYNEHYVSEVVDGNANYFVGHCVYKEYPIKTYKTSNYMIMIEGIIYNYPSMHWLSELEILATILDKRKGRTEELQGWLDAHEGDYVIVVEIRKKIYIVNDVFGRLPLYCHVSEETIVVTRDPHLLSLFGLTEKIDKLGMAMMLLFNHTIGDHTIWENVQYIRGGMLLEIDLLESQLTSTSIFLYNFQLLVKKGQTSRKIANLSELFRKAATDRRNSSDLNVIGLSGGLDSRVVAAALKEFPTIGVTRLREGEKEKSEIPIAQEVASKIPELNWCVLRTDRAKLHDYEALMAMKEGMNSLEMVFKVPYLQKLRERYGAGIHYFTGDGGDRLKPHLPLFGRIDSKKKLIQYILDKHSAIEISTVSKLLKMSNSDIYNCIKLCVENYPEVSYEYKYIHFNLYESAFKYVFEGEDHNRFYFWSVTPFYQKEFFTEVMSIPDRDKQYYMLYRKIIEYLSPEMLYIRNHDDDAMITSSRIMYKLVAKELLKSITDKNTRKNILKITGQKKRRLSQLANKEDIIVNIENSILIKKSLISELELRNILSDDELISTTWIWRVITMLYSAKLGEK